MTKAVQDLMVAVERARDAFHGALFGGTDPAGLVTDDAVVEILPAGTGASGADAIARFAREQLVVPDDLAFRRLSRTGDRFRVVDEEMLGFTHDREMPWLLPGVAPTGRRAEVLVVSLVTVRRDRVTRMRLLVDGVTLAADLELTAART